MKTIKRLSTMLLVAGAALLAACKPGTPEPAPVSTGLTLSVDKNTIMSDGSDKATFTVTFTSESGMEIDVTTAATITYNDGTVLEGNKFVGSEAGEYKFVATYTDEATNETYTSNEVVVTISALQLAADVETINVNGTSVATFTVTYNGEDITGDATINNVTLGTSYAKGANTFSSPGYSGEFTFVATYRNMESNSVVVKVEAAQVGGLRLMVDKARVNSGETVTFTVYNLDNDTDVTSSVILKTEDGSEISNPYTVTGNVKVVAEMTTGDGVMTSPAVSVGTGTFWKRVLINKFTSIGCSYCPMAAEAIEGADKNFPDRIVEIAVHALSMGSDPMAPANLTEYMNYFSQLQTGQLPYMFFDFLPSNSILGGTSANTVLGYVKPLAAMAPEVGISGEAFVADNGDINVKIKVQASKAGEYTLTTQLLENGIAHSQAGAQGNYIHNHTLRETMSANIFGDSLGNMDVNQVVTKEYTITPKSSYVVDNCLIACYVSVKNEEDNTYYAANAIEIPMNGWADCSFE